MELIYCTLEQVIGESPTVKSYRLRPENGERPDFAPGQFVIMHQLKEDGSSTGFRTFSISSSPMEQYLQFTVKTHGKFSTALARLPVGSRLGITRPQGHFVFQEDGHDSVFIAGGVGSAPFRSMINYEVGKKYPHKLTMLYMNRSFEEMVYKGELDAIARENPNFRVVYFLTKQEADGHESGRLDEEKLKKHVPNFMECTYYLCGPPAMVMAMRKMLEEIGVHKDRIKFEAWG